MGPVMDVTLDDESCKLVAHMEESKPGAPGGLINIDKEVCCLCESTNVMNNYLQKSYILNLI